MKLFKQMMTLCAAFIVIAAHGMGQVTHSVKKAMPTETHTTMDSPTADNDALNISTTDPLAPEMTDMRTEMTHVQRDDSPSGFQRATKIVLHVFFHSRFALGVFGIVGNGLSILVILQPNFRQLPVSPYMLGVAVTDSLYLFSRCIVDWFWIEFQYMLPGLTSLCQVRYFFIVASLNISSMLLGALSMERMYAVRYPFLAKVKLTRKLSLALIAATFFGVIAVYSPMLLAINADDCSPVPGWEFYQRNIYVWSQIICTNFVPDVLIVISNVVMAVTIRGRLSAKTNDSSGGDSATHGGTDNQAAMTRLAVTLAITHFVLTMPIMALKAYQLSVGTYNFFTSGPVMSMVESFFLVLIVINHSINFILYVGTSTLFRNAMKKMFCQFCMPG